MDARAVVSKWMGTWLVIGLLGLLIAVSAHAQGPQAASLLPAPAYGLASMAIDCETGILEDGDPFMSVDEMDAACLAPAAPRIQRIDFAGDAALVRSVVNGDLKVHLYLKRAGAWEFIAHGAEPYPYWLYEQG